MQACVYHIKKWADKSMKIYSNADIHISMQCIVIMQEMVIH